MIRSDGDVYQWSIASLLEGDRGSLLGDDSDSEVVDYFVDN